MEIGFWSFYEEKWGFNYSIAKRPENKLPQYIEATTCHPFPHLFKKLRENNIKATLINEVENVNNIDLFVFFDFPKKNSLIKKIFNLNKPKIFFPMENESVLPENWNMENHKLFDKIITWNDDLVDNKKYFKSQQTGYDKTEEIKNISVNLKSFNQKHLCVLFGNNKFSNHSKDLFSKRKEIIEWFEKNHPENFKFYGANWDKKYFSKPRILRILNRVNFVSKLFGATYITHGGWADDKLATLKNYKFSICFENAYGFTGNITEKIFDSFLGSCVPIYLGANNIDDFVPPECFIDQRNFKNINETYQFIKSIDEKMYNNYLENISRFLESHKFDVFCKDYFVNNFLKIFGLERII